MKLTSRLTVSALAPITSNNQIRVFLNQIASTLSSGTQGHIDSADLESVIQDAFKWGMNWYDKNPDIDPTKEIVGEKFFPKLAGKLKTNNNNNYTIESRVDQDTTKEIDTSYNWILEVFEEEIKEEKDDDRKDSKSRGEQDDNKQPKQPGQPPTPQIPEPGSPPKQPTPRTNSEKPKENDEEDKKDESKERVKDEEPLEEPSRSDSNGSYRIPTPRDSGEEPREEEEPPREEEEDSEEPKEEQPEKTEEKTEIKIDVGGIVKGLNRIADILEYKIDINLSTLNKEILTLQEAVKDKNVNEKLEEIKTVLQEKSMSIEDIQTVSDSLADNLDTTLSQFIDKSFNYLLPILTLQEETNINYEKDKNTIVENYIKLLGEFKNGHV